MGSWDAEQIVRAPMSHQHRSQLAGPAIYLKALHRADGHSVVLDLRARGDLACHDAALLA